MNDFWHTFDATFGESLTTTLPESPSVIPLSQLSIVEIKGEDSNDFLQNLLTNDVNQLTLNQAQLTAFCNPKGRIIILFWLIKTQNNHFFALLPEDTAAIFQRRLSMFILRSKVTIDDKSADHVALAIQGDTQAVELISNSTQLNSQFAILEQDKATETIQQLQAEGHQLCDANTWETLLITAGIPSVFADSSEAFTPQQINLELLGGVSFQKGCYPGQEVVARLHYLGSPSRRLFLAKYEGEIPDANSLVTNEQNSTVGHVVSASNDEAQLALVSLKLSDINQHLYVNSKTLMIVKALTEQD
jgi:hypothetical protein